MAIYHLHLIYPYNVTREELLALAKLPNVSGLKIKEIAVCREVTTAFAPSTFDIRVGDPGALVSVFDPEDLPVLNTGEFQIIKTGLDVDVDGLDSVRLYCTDVGSGGGGTRVTAAIILDDEADANLEAINALNPTNGSVIGGNGSTWVLIARNTANGYAGLDGSGKVAAAQLPSYVDDVVEAANFAALPGTGETGKIYVTLDTNKTYRWSGSAYVEISPSPGSTDSVTEGSTNLYFTAARVLAVVLAGLSTGSATAITSSDTILSALGKLQAQINSITGVAAPIEFGVACSDETTAITTGTKATIHAPRSLTLTEVFAGLTTASSSGNPQIDVKKNGTTIFSTKITIDATETTSLTAATPPVISSASISKGDKLEIIVDTAGTGAKGLKVYFLGTR